MVKERGDIMERKKMLTINCISLFSLILIYVISGFILGMNNLAFMHILDYIFIAICGILIMLMLIQSGISAAGGVITMIILCIFGFLGFTFTYEPEHVIEKDGKLMVAYVDSFLDVNVNYYDYKNQFLRGSQLRIYESYGSGGYDPFERDKMPPVKQYIYYDENGEVIKSSY